MAESAELTAGLPPGRPRASTQRRPRWRARLAVLMAGVVTTGIAICVLALLTDGAKLIAAVRSAASDPGVLAALAIGYTMAFWLRALAWRALLRTGPGPWSAFAILQASLALNHLLPVKAGELARPALAARHGAALSDATATTLVARLIDLVALAGIAIVALAVATGGTGSFTLVWLPAVLVAVAATMVLIIRRTSRLTSVLPDRGMAVIVRFRAALQRMSWRQLGVSTALTVPAWLLEGLVLYAVAAATGSPLGLVAATGVTAATILFQVVHITPGGLGIYEASMTGALALVGVPAPDALLLATTTHAVKFAYSLTAGVAIGALALRRSPR